jgi:hypothetical protein
MLMVMKMKYSKDTHAIFIWLMILTLIITVVCIILVKQGFGADRCQSFVQEVRVQHIKQFGLMYPYWYSVSQLATESACRADVTAGDGGRGLAQFMPKTSTYIQGLMGERLDPYNPSHAMRMQAFYMKRIHTLENWDGGLWIDFRIYNGGRGALYSEYKRAGVLDPEIMHMFCQRKKIQFKWGVLDLCLVNKEYAEKIYTGGQKYKRGIDGMRYW